MSRKHPLMPKGEACRVDLSSEYAWGLLAGIAGQPDINPYDFWDEYIKHYSWSVGHQKGSREYREIMEGNYEDDR